MFLSRNERSIRERKFLSLYSYTGARGQHQPQLSMMLYRTSKPIFDEVKRRLLKPLLPRNPRHVPPPLPSRRRKRKAIAEEFDPLPKTLRTTADYQQEILDLFASNKKTDVLTFQQTPWVIGSFLRGWQMDAPERYDADPRASLEKMRSPDPEKARRRNPSSQRHKVSTQPQGSAAKDRAR